MNLERELGELARLYGEASHAKEREADRETIEKLQRRIGELEALVGTREVGGLSSAISGDDNEGYAKWVELLRSVYVAGPHVMDGHREVLKGINSRFVASVSAIVLSHPPGLWDEKIYERYSLTFVRIKLSGAEEELLRRGGPCMPKEEKGHYIVVSPEHVKAGITLDFRPNNNIILKLLVYNLRGGAEPVCFFPPSLVPKETELRAKIDPNSKYHLSVPATRKHELPTNCWGVNWDDDHILSLSMPSLRGDLNMVPNAVRLSLNDKNEPTKAEWYMR